MFSRFEYDLSDNQLTEIKQLIYSNDKGELIILDEGVSPPADFVEFSGIIESKGDKQE